MNTFLRCFLLIWIFIHDVKAKQLSSLVLERAFIECNPKYMVNCTISVTKYNRTRTSPYVLNMNATSLQTWGRNITVDIKSYEWKNNQFKESIMRTNSKFCDFLHTLWFTFFQENTNFPKKCPKKAGLLYMRDFYVPLSNNQKYPNLQLPASTWKFAIQFLLNDKEKIMQCDVILKVEKKITIKKKTK